MKLLVKIVLVLVLLVVIGAIVGVMYVDSYAKSAVEESATNSLGVKTTLATGDVKIFSSEFALTGLNAANPEGFATPHFMTIQDGGVSVTLASLMEDTVELPTLTLDRVDINLEKKAGKSNYNIIMGNLKGDEDIPPDPDKKKFIIRQVKITNVMVHADMLGVGGQLTKLEVPIDEIVLTDVGSEGKGLTLRDLSGVIMKTIFAAIVSKGGALPGEIAAELSNQLASLKELTNVGSVLVEDALGNITGAAGSILKGAGGDVPDALKGASEDVQKAVDEGVGGLLKGAGGLLGGNKEEDKPE
jgi:hypothetical protein